MNTLTIGYCFLNFVHYMLCIIGISNSCYIIDQLTFNFSIVALFEFLLGRHHWFDFLSNEFMFIKAIFDKFFA